MEYSVKNKKYIHIFMIIFLFLVFFSFDKAYAIELKTSTYFHGVNDARQNGVITSGTELWKNVDFNSDFSLANYKYDYVIFRLREINFTNQTASLIDSDVNTRCTYWSQDIQGSNVNYRCNSTTADTLQDYQFVPFDVSVSVYISDPNGTGMTCFFDDTLKDHVICPIVFDNFTIHRITFIMNGLSTGYANNSINYAFRIDRTIFFGNKDSTEIVNALNGVSIDINATTSAIETQTQQQAQQNAYVQNNNITQAQTNTTTSITTLNDQLTAELSQFSDLTQLVLAPITIFMELNNNVCAPLSLQIPFVGGTAVIPCMKPVMQQYFGTMYSVFTTVIGAILCYWTFVRTVALIKDLVDADNDKIEVVDL